MYMEDREWEAIKQSEDKGIMMGTTITIKLNPSVPVLIYSGMSENVQSFKRKRERERETEREKIKEREK